MTDRGAFRDCRRRWYLENVKRLAPRSQVAYALEFGTIIHTGLEWYYRSGRDVTVMLEEFKAVWEQVDNRLARDYGGLYQMGVEEEWWNHYLLGEQMLRNYDSYDRRERWFDEVIEINLEERSYVPIRDQRGGDYPGHPLLSGRVDLVVRKGNDFWIWDHKTAVSKPSFRALDIDDQGTGYCYITYRALGIIPRGFLYNVLLKRAPKDPRLLKSGELSRDKSLLMTYDHYLASIHRHGLDPKDYSDHLSELWNRGYSDFFVRDTSFRNKEQLQEFERRLSYEYRDMEMVLQDPDWAYPNPSQRLCSSCSVLPICHAMEERGNVENIIDTMYLEQESRYEIPERLKVGNSDET